MSDDRECTCNPDEAPVPCQKQYAFTECEILRLRAENAKLRAVLKIVAGMANGEYIADEQIRAARAAYLGEKND